MDKPPRCDRCDKHLAIEHTKDNAEIFSQYLLAKRCRIEPEHLTAELLDDFAALARLEERLEDDRRERSFREVMREMHNGV